MSSGGSSASRGYSSKFDRSVWSLIGCFSDEAIARLSNACQSKWSNHLHTIQGESSVQLHSVNRQFSVPVNLRVLLNICNAFALVSQAISWRLPAQSSDQMLRALWYFLRHLHDVNAPKNHAIRFHVGFLAERRLPDQQFVNENAQRPVVNGSIVPALQNNFGRNVLCSSENESSRLSFGQQMSAKLAKNNYLVYQQMSTSCNLAELV